MKNLKEHRMIKKGLLQKDVAKKVNISNSFYSMIEGGSRICSFPIAKKIALALDLSLDEFYLLYYKNK